jgi:hypothetical protein
MKANIPRSWHSLPQREKEAIKKLMTEHVYELVDEEEKQIQVTWMKMCCIILHEVYGFGETRLLRFIARWKRMYARNKRYTNEKDRDAWLDEEMKKLFKTCGFPDLRIQEMKDM